MTKKLEDDSALKKLWAYMIDEGTETTGEWSYYGSGWEYPNRGYRVYEGVFTVEEIIRKAVGESKNINVSIPRLYEHNSFVGTDEESEQCTCLLGSISIEDGPTFLVGVNNCSTRLLQLFDEVNGAAKAEPEAHLVNRIFGGLEIVSE